MFRQRRSLGKNISQSNRVNKLSDIGALLYTWMIPHYDDEGRMPGDPEDVRYNILPRRKITDDQVVECLSEMDNLDLIAWYIVDGEPCIQMNLDAWKSHQRFKGIKKTPSKIPEYNPKHHKKYVSTLEGGQVHPKGWTGTPQRVDASTLPGPQEKRREEKNNSFSSNEEKRAEPAPHSNPELKHFSGQIDDPQYLKPILRICKSLQLKSNATTKFNSYRWVQRQTNNRGHPGAILKALTSLLNNWETTKKPEGYLTHIMNIEGQNFNEADNRKAYKQIKQEMAELEKSDDGQKLIGMLDAIKEL